MFSIKVSPRFGDVDALGHVNNTVPAAWFELGRTALIKIFDPDLTLSLKTFPLIIAHTEYDFLHQMYIKYDVEIRTGISKIGTKSFTVYQEAWQNEIFCVKGNAVIVYYDFIMQKTAPIPDDKRKLLEKYLEEKTL